LRRCPGYDLSDPWLAAAGDEDGYPSKPREARKLLVPGLPCHVIGESGRVVAYMGPAGPPGKPGSSPDCQVRLPGGELATRPRRRLLPLPTREPHQGDWALPVDLSGDLARLNGMRVLCGIGGYTTEKQPGFWVMFQTNAAEPPEVELIPVNKLVALPGPPPGATRTPWEAKFGALEGPGLDALEDEAAADARREQKLLSLCDGHEEDEEDDDKSEDLSGSEGSSAGAVMEEGSLVQVQMSGTPHLALVEQMPSDEAEDVNVRLLPDAIQEGGQKSFPRASLSVTDQQKAELEAVCLVCGSEHPEEDLLICENFCKNCASTVHAQCLKPPQKVPAGDWYCSACSKKRKSTDEPSAAAKLQKTSAAKAKAAAKAKQGAVKAKAKAVKAKK